MSDRLVRKARRRRWMHLLLAVAMAAASLWLMILRNRSLQEMRRLYGWDDGVRSSGSITLDGGDLHLSRVSGTSDLLHLSTADSRRTVGRVINRGTFGIHYARTTLTLPGAKAAIWTRSDARISLIYPSALALLASIGFIVRQRAWGRMLRRRRAGLCMKCGYDLRASDGRCPECGTPAPKR